MGFKRWIIKQENEQEAQLLSEVFEIDRAAATVASVRGIADLVTYEDFMFADPYESCRPFEIKDMEKAVKSIYTAVKKIKIKITVSRRLRLRRCHRDSTALLIFKRYNG